MDENKCENGDSLLGHKKKCTPIIVEKIEDEKIATLASIEPPDGGWGWVIAASCFTIVILSIMPVGVYSIIYSDILMSGKTSTTINSLIYSAGLFVLNFSAILAPALCTYLGYRKMSILGNFLAFLGVSLSAFATSPMHLFICFSLIYGLGVGIVMPVQHYIIPQYFKKMRGLILGLNMACMSISLFLGPVLVGALHTIYAYQGATLILGAIMANGIVAGSLFHPVGWDAKKSKAHQLNEIQDTKEDKNNVQAQITKENKPEEPLLHPVTKRIRLISERSNISFELLNDVQLYNSDINISRHDIDDKITKKNTYFTSIILKFLKGIYETFTILKSHRMKIITIGYFLVTPCFMNVNMLVPFLLKERGHSLEVALGMLSMSNVSGFVSRIIISFVIDRLPFSTKHYFMFGVLLASAATLMFTLVTDMLYFSVAVCLFGGGQGCSMVVLTLMNIEFMGMEYLYPSYSIIKVAFSFGMIIIGPLLGVIRDATSSYNFTMRMLSGSFLIAFLIWFLMPIAQSSDKKRGCLQPSQINTND